MMLSLCIPTYNRARKLDRLLGQLSRIIATSRFRERVEVIISNNASTDETEETVKKHMEHLSRLCRARYYAQRENIGSERNFKFLYEQAEGAYVWLVADDDVPVPDQLDALIQDLERYRPAVCLSSFKQPPFTESERLFMCGGRDLQVIQDQRDAIHHIAKFPKITMFAIKRYWLSEGERKITDKGLATSYWIVTLTIVLFLNKGGSLLVRSANVAHCDSDYLDLRFSPRVFRTLRDAVLLGLGDHPLAEDYKRIPGPDVDGMTVGLMFRHCIGSICMDANIAREELVYIRRHWRNLMFSNWKNCVKVAAILVLGPLVVYKKTQHV
jgi:glycosyltransferase involved in cell wall biosynthesis